MIWNSLAFWTMVVGLLAYVIRFFMPTFPFDETQILAAVLFVLGLVGIVPAARASAKIRGALAVAPADILKSLQFWTLLSGVVAFVLHFYFPTFPFEQSAILAFVVFVLGFFQITPELRARGLK